jgi:hypothetical protein
MGIIDKAKQAAGTVAGVAVLVNVTKNDVHHEVDRVTLAGVPLFTRDQAGKPFLFGLIPLRRRKAPRAG